MARDWIDLFITDAGGADGDRVGAPQDERGRRRNLFARLRESMSKTREALGSEIQATLLGPLDAHTCEPRASSAIGMYIPGRLKTCH